MSSSTVNHPAEPPPAPAAPPPARRRGRRHARIFWTITSLLAAAVLGTWIGIRLYTGHRTAEYKPGEANPEITRLLDQPYQGDSSAKDASPAAPAPAGAVSDGLRRNSRKLPAGAPPPSLVDVTAESGLGSFRTFAGARTSQLPEDMGSGAAWGDFDNDGYDDLFLVAAGGPLDAPPSRRAPSRLYRNLGNGRFQAVEDFPDTRILGMGAAFADYNNDGWLDLIVTGYNTLLLFRNDHGKFVRDTRFPNPKGFWAGAAWGDYNRDGNLDLYICGYVEYNVNPAEIHTLTHQFGLDVPYTLNPSSFEPSRNLLFRNNGDGTFTEVAARLGVANAEGRSLGAVWHDFDEDGWPDLYVANDVSENKLYLNRHGKFIDAGKQAWVSEYRGSMGLAVGDWDGDGDDDLFISHWVAQQYALYSSLLADQRKAAARSPAMVKDAGELHFMDVAEMSGIGQISLQSIGWGTAFADFDSDGWLDLVVANGSTFETQDHPPRLVPMPAFFFWNNRGKFFYDLAPWNKSLSTPHASRGLAVADFDNDGAMDILVVDHGEGVRLLRNQMRKGHWAEVKLRSRNRKSGPVSGFADGAQLVAWVGGRELRRAVVGGSYLSQHTRRVHFGLGDARQIDKLDVRWPEGPSETYAGLAADAIWEITQGDPLPRRCVKPEPESRSGQAPGPSNATPPSREKQVEFWKKQRAAMDAIKKDNDIPRATTLLRQALAIDPNHEDSRYYLANCLVAQGDPQGALAQLEQLQTINPQSHRAYQRRGFLLATLATTPAGLRAAEESLQQARSLNPEETGTLLLLGEVSLLLGDSSNAGQRLEWACRTNPRAVGGAYLRAYLAWKRKDPTQARVLLQAAQTARGKEWKPKGSVAEGDVRRRMHDDATLLSAFWTDWDGTLEPENAFRGVDAYVNARAKGSSDLAASRLTR